MDRITIQDSLKIRRADYRRTPSMNTGSDEYQSLVWSLAFIVIDIRQFIINLIAIDHPITRLCFASECTHI